MAGYTASTRKPKQIVWNLMLGAWILVVAGAATISHAQQWRPERTVEIVVPAGTGGSIDGTARLIHRVLQFNRIIDTPVIVVNKPGGGGNIATSYLDQHAGDGHYLLTSTMSIMTNHILGRSSRSYNDYTPLATLFSEYMTLVVKPDSPLKTAADIQEQLMKDPQSLSIAIGVSLGATNHLTVALLAKAMGVDARRLKMVVTHTNSQAVTSVMGGHIDIGSLSAGAALNAAQQGQLRIIGITSEKRGDGPLANVPTWKEQGIDVVFANVRLLLGPRGMSAAQVAYWDAALAKIVSTSDWKKEVDRNEAIPDYAASKESAQRMGQLYGQLKAALVDAGLAKE
jgi:putative tricarboxylic transport membrane protein